MKRKFISAMLFGALLVAPATTFVGCSDYDDDIENLQGQITNNATTLDELTKEKLANVETEIKSLKDAQAQLKEAQEKATTDGDAATLAAATQLVNEAQARLQAALDAVNGDITAVNGKISDLDARLAVTDGKLNSVEALLAADGKITLAINDAQAMADKAYALAEQTAATANENKEAIKAAADNLKSIKESLEAQINTLSDKINDLSKELADKNAALVAQIGSLENQIKEAKDGNAANADKILANEGKINELTSQLEALKQEVANNKLAVETLESNMLSKIKDVVNSTNTSINELKSANAAAEERLTAAEGRLDTVEDLIASIKSTKADDAAIRALIEQVKSELQTAQGVDKANLEKAISDLTAVVNGKASSGDLSKAISDLKSEIEKSQSADKSALEKKVSDLDSKIQTALSKKADTKYVDDKIDELNKKFGELQASLDGLKNEDGSSVANVGEALAAVQRNIDTVEKGIKRIDGEIARIDGLIDVLFTDLSNMITGIINQDVRFAGVYAQVTNKGDNNNANPTTSTFFGASRNLNEYTIEQVGGSVLATVNPANVDFSGTALSLLDSKDEANPLFKLSPATSAENESVITRAAAKNGLYKYNVVAINEEVKTNPGVRNNKAYALAAQYDWQVKGKDGKPADADKRGVYSKYELGFDLRSVQNTKVTTNDMAPLSSDARLDYAGSGYTEANNAGGEWTVKAYDGSLKFTLKLNTNGKKAYAKYIKCTDTNVTGGPDKVNKAINGTGIVLKATTVDNKGNVTTNKEFEEITIDADQFDGNGKYIFFDYYVWNYDGSIAKRTLKFFITKPMFAPQTITETVDPYQAGNLVHYAVNDLKCFTSKSENDILKNNATNFDIKNVTGSVYHVMLKDANKQTKSQVSKGTDGKWANTSLGNANNIASIKKIAFDYNVNELEVGKTYKFDIVFRNNRGDEVNTVTVEYKLGELHALDGKVSPLEPAFDTPWGTTTAWATYVPAANNQPAYATYKLEASFNNIGIDIDGKGSKVAFNDKTDYWTVPSGQTVNPNAIYMPIGAVQGDTWFTNQINVPLAAVSANNGTGHVYDLTTGVMYYGLKNLWKTTELHTFKLAWKSPIYYAKNFTVSALSVNYPGTLDIVDSNIKAYDPSKATPTLIKYLAAKDSRIASLAISYANGSENYAGLFENFGFVNADGSITKTSTHAQAIRIITNSNVALQHDTNVEFTLKVTDVFGCSKSYNFTVTVKKNSMPEGIRRR